MFEHHNLIDPWDQTEDDLHKDNFWWSAIVVLLVLAFITFCPRSCNAKTIPCDTIPITWEQVDTIFKQQTASGKSEKLYVVFVHKGYKDITIISKSTHDYILMCKNAKIKPRLALRIKDGQVVSIIKDKQLRL